MIEANMKAQIQKYEEMCLNGHVALNTFLYDGWLLKFSEGYTGRANSYSTLLQCHLLTRYLSANRCTNSRDYLVSLK